MTYISDLSDSNNKSLDRSIIVDHVFSFAKLIFRLRLTSAISTR